MATRRSKPAPAIGDLFAPRTNASVQEEDREEEEDTPPPAIAETDATDATGATGATDATDATGRPAAQSPVAEQAPAPPSPAPFVQPDRDFEYNGGIHLVDSILWCDADRRHDLCFVSHAHVDAIGKNRRMLATDKTIRILTRGSGKIEALTSPYKRSFTLGPLELEMHPAGHVLGSAQLLIIRNNRRLVYTSDINTRATATAERARPVPCDVLVIPATYGDPMFKFPPREEVYEQIKTFVDRCLEDRATPVLLANQIGTSQELMRMLGEGGYRLRVHRSIYDVAKIYGDLGVNLPGSRRFTGSPARDEVVIFPPILRKHASIRKLRKSQTAIVSGNAVDPGYLFRQRVDRAFPLSDTADHDELVQFIEETGARDVYLSSGYIDELGAELRAKGMRVYPLVRPEQLTLF